MQLDQFVREHLHVLVLTFGLELLEQRVLSLLEPAIQRCRAWTPIFGGLQLRAIVIEPLHTLHVKLEFTITELLNIRNSKWQVHFLDIILEKSKVSLVVCLVFCRKI